MNVEQLKRKNEIAEAYLQEYTELIDKISEPYADDPLWWATPLSSRNIHLDNTYDIICTELLNKEQSDSVEKPCNKKKSIVEYPIIRTLYVLYWFNKYHKQKKIIKGKTGRYFGKSSILICSPRELVEFKGNGFQNRFYPGIEGYLPDGVLFIDRPYGVTKEEIKGVISGVGSFRDHVLASLETRYKDIFEIFRYIRLCRRAKVRNAIIGGIDVSPIVNESLVSGAYNTLSWEGVLRGVSMSRMVKAYEAECVIDYYEGQTYSNAMFARVRRENPSVKTVAYTYGLMGETAIHMSPSNMQVNKKGAAEIYAIQGRYWESYIKRFSDGVNCAVGPAFRHQAVYEDVKDVEEEKNSILVVLSYEETASTKMLRAVSGAVKETSDKRLLIKNHPSNSEHTLLSYGIDKSEFAGIQYEFVNGNMSELIDRSENVILTVTSTTFDVLIKGKNTICYVDGDGIMDLFVPKDMYRYLHIAYNAEDIAEGLKQKTGMTESERRDYLERSYTPLGKDTMKEFIDSIK